MVGLLLLVLVRLELKLGEDFGEHVEHHLVLHPHHVVLLGQTLIELAHLVQLFTARRSSMLMPESIGG